MFEQKLSSEDYLQEPFSFVENKLLGAVLCSRIGGVMTAGRITEVEVYLGGIDKAAHSYNYRRTPRTEIQYEKGGRAYVFFIYGMYYQFNVTLSEENVPNVILIRSLEPLLGIEEMQRRRKTDNIKNLTTGPGKLCQALGIDKTCNGKNLCGNELWISPRDNAPIQWNTTPRIGIDYAGEYKDKPWRYILRGNPFLSRPI